MKKIILGVTGSISAYKAADIANGLVKSGCNVNVIMTAAATGFITPLTMQAPTKNRGYTNVLQEDEPSIIAHIDLAKSADALLIAPATANIIGKIAGGIADDMLTSCTLAVKDVPRIIAPAMNCRMYENEAVQNNLQILKERGWKVIEPRSGRLACGDTGKGALAAVDDILSFVKKMIGENV